MTVVNIVSFRMHILTDDERQFIAGSGPLSPYIVLLMMTFAGMLVALGLAGGWYLFLAEDKSWLFPWEVAMKHPYLTTAWAPIAVWLAWRKGYKPLKRARMKLFKLRSNTATQADIDAWTMEVTGQIFRTATNETPQLLNDLTLESAMADATFRPPRA